MTTPSNIRLGEVDCDHYEEVCGQVAKTTVKMPITIHSCVKPFVEILANENPTWEFVPSYVDREYSGTVINNRHYSNTTSASCRIFIVRQGVDELGTIGAQQWGDRKFTVTNNRIRAERERGSEYATKDITKAIKKVKATFHPKTTEELIKELTRGVYGAVENVSRKHRMAFNEVYRVGERFMKEYLNANLEQFQEFIGDKVGAMSNYRELLLMMKETSAFESLFENGSLTTVAILNDQYFIGSKDNTAKHNKPREQVDPDIIRKVGMLKLLDDGGYVSDVGVKVKENVFVINYNPNNVSQGEQP